MNNISVERIFNEIMAFYATLMINLIFFSINVVCVEYVKCELKCELKISTMKFHYPPNQLLKYNLINKG